MQCSMFDGSQELVVNKPIRLIELFAGYGSQHFALEYLGVKFESWKICEWAVKSIQAYKDAHFGNDNKDYSLNHSTQYIVNYLYKKGISSNYNEPMTKEQIKRLGEEKQRQIYNNIKATHNLVNIQQVQGSDLEIVDTDKYCYIMTYSFPCQDLSLAGLGKGMEKGGGTRSGMLWEVERILDEIAKMGGQLPQILLMENVPEVIGSKNIKHFAKWLEKLETLGYKSKWQVLNAKDYGIPQNRNRCFMISMLGDYYYEFPQKQKLELRLKDLLEDEVAEKYYLSDRALQGSINTNFCCSKLENKLPKDGIVPTLLARDYKDPKLVEISSGQSQGYRVYDIDGISASLCANGGGLGAQTGLYLDTKENLKTQLCNSLITSGQVKEGDVIRHSYSNSRMNKFYASNKENKDCSPTLDTRCDCLGVVVNSNNKRLKNLVNKTQFGDETMALDCYNQVLHKDYIQTIRANFDKNNMNMVYTDYRIRKLTPKECFRLMGVKDQDFEKIAQNQSNASLYHLAGDSIVVNVLMEIFKKFLRRKYES